MRRIAAKFVPRLLKNEQWDHRVQVCTELQKAVRHDPNFLSRAITGDVRPPVISMCSLKWNSGWKDDVSPPLKRSKQNRDRYETRWSRQTSMSASKSGKIAEIVV
jgi:hypothetical protein